jgi:hypothetical protein
MRIKRSAIFFVFIFFTLILSGSQENVQAPSLPEIGKWLLRKDGQPSHWFGEKYKNKILYEPINIVIIDEYSKDERAAVEKLMRECAKAGYEEESGHSSGYRASIDNILFPQIPNDKRVAFANKDFFLTNNHGRIMGPSLFNGKYIFVAAFSTESFKVLDKAHHRYVSFIRARNDFCARMELGKAYRITGNLDLANIVDDAEFTTGDHDGMALILTAVE